MADTEKPQKHYKSGISNTKEGYGLGQVAQLVRALYRYIKVAGLIPGQGTYKNQPINMWNKKISVSLSLSLFLKSI